MARSGAFGERCVEAIGVVVVFVVVVVVADLNQRRYVRESTVFRRSKTSLDLK